MLQGIKETIVFCVIDQPADNTCWGLVESIDGWGLLFLRVS